MFEDLLPKWIKSFFLICSCHQSHLCPWNFHDFYQYPSGMVFHWVWLDLDAIVWRYSAGHLLCNASLLLDHLLWRAHDGKSKNLSGKGQWIWQNKLVATGVSSGIRLSVPISASPLVSWVALDKWLNHSESQVSIYIMGFMYRFFLWDVNVTYLAGSKHTKISDYYYFLFLGFCSAYPQD